MMMVIMVIWTLAIIVVIKVITIWTLAIVLITIVDFIMLMILSGRLILVVGHDGASD